ncbi:MAG TPA: hypothetical protein VMV10_14735 [Pirellulales bacterium]|nr:hypothetical protein [Pirellulales bacterium]
MPVRLESLTYVPAPLPPLPVSLKRKVQIEERRRKVAELTLKGHRQPIERQNGAPRFLGQAPRRQARREGRIAATLKMSPPLADSR